MGNATCSFPECPNPSKTRGYCQKHYMRVWRHGSPDTRTRERRPSGVSVEDWFWTFVDKTDTCWLWTGKLAGRGYGQVSAKVDGEWVMVYAHRVSYERHHGPIPAGMEVLHSCDVPACVNPDHLSVGNHLDNMMGAHERGRTHRKIPSYWVPAIRHSIDTALELSRFFGVARANIYKIRSRENFAWVPE